MRFLPGGSGRYAADFSSEAADSTWLALPLAPAHNTGPSLEPLILDSRAALYPIPHLQGDDGKAYRVNHLSRLMLAQVISLVLSWNAVRGGKFPLAAKLSYLSGGLLCDPRADSGVMPAHLLISSGHIHSGSSQHLLETRVSLFWLNSFSGSPSL